MKKSIIALSVLMAGLSFSAFEGVCADSDMKTLIEGSRLQDNKSEQHSVPEDELQGRVYAKFADLEKMSDQTTSPQL